LVKSRSHNEAKLTWTVAVGIGKLKRITGESINMNKTYAVAGILTLLLGTAGCAPKGVSYSRDVQPILAKSCVGCHTPGKEGTAASGLDMSSYEGLMKGTKFGAVIKPGDAFTSAFNMLIEGRASPTIRMPHGKEKLSDKEIALMKAWVNEGAKNN
jgi:mono/diheme cytochrome c family protein